MPSQPGWRAGRAGASGAAAPRAFSRERGEAQASVVLTMQGSQRLDREGVQAVLHLVAMAVPGLAPRNVSIIDSREDPARGGQTVGSGAASQEDMRRAQELRCPAPSRKCWNTLGPGRVRAEASIDMDFDRIETREERFGPENSVPRSTQSVQEATAWRAQQRLGADNLPGGDSGGGAGTQESRQEETAISRSAAPPAAPCAAPNVRRISVAVLVDGVPEVVDGATRMRERTAEECSA